MSHSTSMPTRDTETTSSETASGATSSAETASMPVELLSPVDRLAARVTKRENAQTKGLRLLLEGRLRVVRVDGDLIIATCRGDSGAIYDLGHEPGATRPWRCTCPAVGPCSHLHALWHVTAVVER